MNWQRAVTRITIAALKVLLCAALLMVVLSAPAYADSIGGPFPCPNNSCQGSIYTLTYHPTPVSSTASTQTFQVTLTIDTSGYSGRGTFIDNVAIKVSSMVNTINSSLVSAPGGVGGWKLSFGGINANGCSAKGSGFECADATISGTGGPAPVPARTYMWVINLNIPTGSLDTSVLGASIKARYVNNSGQKVGALVSENTTLQAAPEPGSLVLFGSGLVAVAAFVRRRARMNA